MMPELREGGTLESMREGKSRIDCEIRRLRVEGKKEFERYSSFGKFQGYKFP